MPNPTTTLIIPMMIQPGSPSGLKAAQTKRTPKKTRIAAMMYPMIFPADIAYSSLYSTQINANCRR